MTILPSVGVVLLSGGVAVSTVPACMLSWSGKVGCPAVLLLVVSLEPVEPSVEPSRVLSTCSVETMMTVGDVMLWVLVAPDLE